MARQVRAAALVELLKTEGLSFSDSKRSWLLDCPKCGKHKWAILKTSGYSKCYHCQGDFEGWADRTIALAVGRPRSEYTQLLYGTVVTTAAVEPSEDRFVDHWGESEGDSVEIVTTNVWPPEVLPGLDHRDLDSELGAPGLKYLEGRGVSLGLAQEYGLKYDSASQRVIFPIVVEGVLRGWQGRLIKPTRYTDKKGRERELPKALTEGEVGGKVLVFQDRLKGAPHGIITEGPFDALKCHLCGGNTATMGKSVTSEQLDIYVRHFRLKKLYIGLDDDAAEDVMRITRELAWYGDIEIYRLQAAPGRDDLGDGTLEENLEQFRSAPRISSGIVISFQKDHKILYETGKHITQFV